MADPNRPALRHAHPGDADTVAALHADSWRRHYRGAYSDAFLDGDVEADRRALWRQRLHEPAVPAATLLAVDDDGVSGFVHVVFDEDRDFGALVDNLHVRRGRQRAGVGSALMTAAAAAVRERPASGGMYLWVLEQNRAAQAFYDAFGGRAAERVPVAPPGGDPARLHGTPAKLRYVWATADLVVRRCASR